MLPRRSARNSIAPALLATGHIHCGTIERRVLHADGRERRVAGLLATSTGVGAHPAVLHIHLLGVVLALLGAQPARFGASLKSGPSHHWLKLRLPRDDPPRSSAHVGAVEAHSDTAPHMADHFLAEAGIGAGGAGLGAVKAGLDALHWGWLVHHGLARVGLDHLLSVGHGTLLPLAFATWRTPSPQPSKPVA